MRQWAKLRWGVFDEHYEEGNGAKPYYVTEKGIQGTRCSEDVKGSVIDTTTNKQCKRDGLTGEYPEDCVFEPRTHGQSAQASLMFSSKLDSVNYFVLKKRPCCIKSKV